MNWVNTLSAGVSLVLCAAAWASAEEKVEQALQNPAGPQLVHDAAYSEEERQYLEWARGVWESLSPQTGEVALEQAGVTLNVPDDFYFLNASDASVVLEDVWGNPPDPYVLGMLFPAELTPFDAGAWGVEIQYEEDGYVSDEDAGSIDYSTLLRDMQHDAREANKERVKNGYEPVELVGWASEPFYDGHARKLHWAKELKFGDMEETTLNYNVRVLGRKGVLVLNFIAGMPQKAEIEERLDAVVAMAEFNPGSRYADFNPDIDKVAAYGIGALIAGKAASKAGLLAAAVLFLKKFWVYILLGIGVVSGNVLKRRKKAAAAEPAEPAS